MSWYRYGGNWVVGLLRPVQHIQWYVLYRDKNIIFAIHSNCVKPRILKMTCSASFFAPSIGFLSAEAFERNSKVLESLRHQSFSLIQEQPET